MTRKPYASALSVQDSFISHFSNVFFGRRCTYTVAGVSWIAQLRMTRLHVQRPFAAFPCYSDLGTEPNRCRVSIPQRHVNAEPRQRFGTSRDGPMPTSMLLGPKDVSRVHVPVPTYGRTPAASLQSHSTAMRSSYQVARGNNNGNRKSSALLYATNRLYDNLGAPATSSAARIPAECTIGPCLQRPYHGPELCRPSVRIRIQPTAHRHCPSVQQLRMI